MSETKFPLGQIVATPGALSEIERLPFALDIREIVEKFASFLRGLRLQNRK